MPKQVTHRKQRGLASLEFALMFIIIFSLFYALIGYAIPLLLGAAYQQLAADGLREAVRQSDIYRVTDENSARMINQAAVKKVIAESWLPDKWAKPCKGYNDEDEGNYLLVNGDEWSVCIQNDNPGAILPTFSILDFKIPVLPKAIIGEAKLRIR